MGPRCTSYFPHTWSAAMSILQWSSNAWYVSRCFWTASLVRCADLQAGGMADCDTANIWSPTSLHTLSLQGQPVLSFSLIQILHQLCCESC
jgi:hypothetical protein